MSSRLRQAGTALALTVGVAGLGWLLKVSGWAYWLWLIGLGTTALVATIWPASLLRLASATKQAVRERLWRAEQGRHYAFSGITLHIESDARHEWMAAGDLKRVLRSTEPEDVIAARHSGHWRRDARGQLMLRVDAVVQGLASSHQRTDPRIIRLRLYLERDVLFPAALRRKSVTKG